MKAFSKVGLLLAVALLATAAAAVSAQAVSFNPDNTAVSGVASNPTLSYGDATVVCDTGTVDGTTGTDSAIVDNAAVDFFEPCNVSGILDADVDCGDGSSTVDLVAEADGGVGGTGTVTLNDDFHCTVSVLGVCNITVDGPQTTDSGNLTLNETTDVTTADVDVQAANDGSELCGPASGTANFTANYATTPSNLTIDP